MNRKENIDMFSVLSFNHLMIYIFIPNLGSIRKYMYENHLSWGIAWMMD